MDEPPTTKIPIDQASLFEMVGDEEVRIGPISLQLLLSGFIHGCAALCLT
jgi:hypothetical protein